MQAIDDEDVRINGQLIVTLAPVHRAPYETFLAHISLAIMQ